MTQLFANYEDNIEFLFADIESMNQKIEEIKEKANEIKETPTGNQINNVDIMKGSSLILSIESGEFSS